MAEFTYNIPALFKAAFGLPYILPHQIKFPSANYTTPDLIEEASADNVRSTSSLGTLIHDIVELVHKPSGTRIQLPDVLLFDVQQAKNIVRTSIQGRDGTVKEYINLDDYSIRFRALFINDNSENPPSDEVKDFINMWKRNEELDVISNELNDVFGIMSIVLTDAEWQQLEGTQNVLALSLSAISDEPKEITTKNLTLLP